MKAYKFKGTKHCFEFFNNNKSNSILHSSQDYFTYTKMIIYGMGEKTEVPTIKLLQVN